MKAAKSRLRNLLGVVLALAAAVSLSACGPSAAESTRFDWGFEHRSELEAWAAKEVDIAIEATGIGVEGWSLGYSEPPLFWDVDRDELLAKAPRGPCTVENFDGAWPWMLEFDVRHDGRTDAVEIVELVRSRWIAEGWTVEDVVTPADTPDAKSPITIIRADREGEREGLGFTANEHLLMIHIYSDCSEDGSMVP